MVVLLLHAWLRFPFCFGFPFSMYDSLTFFCLLLSNVFFEKMLALINKYGRTNVQRRQHNKQHQKGNNMFHYFTQIGPFCHTHTSPNGDDYHRWCVLLCLYGSNKKINVITIHKRKHVWCWTRERSEIYRFSSFFDSKCDKILFPSYFYESTNHFRLSHP